MKSFVVLWGILALPVSLAMAQEAPVPDANPAPATPPVVQPAAPEQAPATQPGPAPAPATQPAPATPPVTVAAPPKTTTAPAPPVTAPVPADDTERLAQATKSYNAGLVALKKSDWHGAAVNFERATQLSPNDAGALSFLGFVRLQQKQWDAALTALQSAQDNAKNLDVHSRAQLLNNIGFARWNKNQIPEAKTAFEGALSLDPNYTDARYNLAFALLSNSDFKDALPYLKQLGTDNPKDATIQDGLGDALSKTGNSAGALGAYKRATQLAPQNVDYGWKFSLALIKSSRPADATTELRRVLQLDPANTAALLQMGDLHLKSAHYGDAASVLKRYVQIKPDDFTGRFNLGVAYDYTPKFDEALEQYAVAERLRPNDAATKNNIGRIYFKRDKYPEAIAKFNEALKIDPNFPDARTNLAIVLAAQEKWDDSNAQWQTLASTAETSLRGATTSSARTLYSSRAAIAHSGLASNFLAQGANQKAVDEYRRLLTVAPGDLEARSGLGRALYNLKDYAGAEAAYGIIIKANPKNADAYNDMGVSQEAHGQRKQALESYSKALEIDPNHTEAKGNIARLKNAAPIG